MEDFKKYFNNKEYITKVVGADEDADAIDIKNDKITSLIELLTLSQNKDFKEETLLILKKEKAGDLLISAIKKAKKNKHVIVAACWESEINFSNHLLFFTQLVLDSDYLISLEAITVISTMEGPFNSEDIKQSIELVRAEQQKLNSERVVLLNDLVISLQAFQA